MHVVQESKRHN